MTTVKQITNERNDQNIFLVTCLCVSEKHGRKIYEEIIHPHEIYDQAKDEIKDNIRVLEDKLLKLSPGQEYNCTDTELRMEKLKLQNLKKPKTKKIWYSGYKPVDPKKSKNPKNFKYMVFKCCGRVCSTQCVISRKPKVYRIINSTLQIQHRNFLPNIKEQLKTHPELIYDEKSYETEKIYKAATISLDPLPLGLDRNGVTKWYESCISTNGKIDTKYSQVEIFYHGIHVTVCNGCYITFNYPNESPYIITYINLAVIYKHYLDENDVQHSVRISELPTYIPTEYELHNDLIEDKNEVLEDILSDDLMSLVEEDDAEDNAE